MVPFGAFGSFGSFAVAGICLPIGVTAFRRRVRFRPRTCGAAFVGALCAVKGTSMCEQRFAACSGVPRGTSGMSDGPLGSFDVPVVLTGRLAL